MSSRAMLTALLLALLLAVPITGTARDDQPEPVPNEEWENTGAEAPDAEAASPADPAPLGPHGDAGESAVTESRPEDHEFVILDKRLQPGELRQFNWQLETAMAGLAVPTPVLVAHGREQGPKLCLVAAVHGDELNGVEIVRRIMFNLDLDNLTGTVVGLPIANAFGFLRSSRYLPDRRDLNRYFPGAATGSMASRFAHALFTEVISHCNVLVDIHTGSFFRTNLPQLRADLTIGPVLNLTKQFGDIAVLHSLAPTGSLRRAATDAGIAAVTMETGGPARFQRGAVEAGVKAIEALLNHLDMIDRFRPFGEPPPVIYHSTWVRAETGGILLAEVKLGDTVEKGQRLGTVTDPIQNRREPLQAPFRGRILGMAVDQVVMPGFAAFHIGRVASEKEAIESTTAGEVSQPDIEYLEDVEPFVDEEEYFDPAAAGTDEPEPESPPESRAERLSGDQGFDRVPAHPEEPEAARPPSTTGARREPATLQDRRGWVIPHVRWLPESESAQGTACIRPPLAECH